MNITFDEAIQAITNSKQTLLDELTRHDRTVSDFQHLFEFGNFPDNVVLEIHKCFVDTLHKRRDCKNKLSLFNSIENKSRTQRNYFPQVLTAEFTQYKQYLKTT